MHISVLEAQLLQDILGCFPMNNRNTALTKTGFLADSNSTGRIRGWEEDEMVVTNGQETSRMEAHVGRKRQSTSEYIRQRFGVVEEIQVESNSDYIPVEDLQPMATIIRRRRKSTITFVRDLLGL